MEKNMQKNFQIKSLVLLTVALIVLSIALFVTAMSSGQPGQGSVFQVRSGILLVTAFAIPIALASFLLIIIFRIAHTSLPIESAPVQSENMRIKRSVSDASGLKPADRTEEPSQLVSDTVGELRTSVDVIQEELEEIIEDDLPVDKEQMQSLYQETDRLKKIIDGMEQLSKARAMAGAIKKERLEVEPLLKSIIEKTRLAVTGRNVIYSLDCEAGLVMMADPVSLSTILGNIADNAARSIRESGSVNLSAGRKGEQVVFSIKDTGIGIRRGHLSHIYERFFRGADNGVGLGLSIAKELVDAYGGNIEVQTETGKGTSFTVQIPAA